MVRASAMFALAAAAVVAGCAGSPALQRDFSQGAYYTRYSLFEERDIHRTTNYRRGVLVPINTQVTLVAAGRDRIEVRIESNGHRLVVENVRKHTSDTLEEAFDRVFSPQPIDLSKFSADEQHAIRQGQALPGMNKEAVLAAMGPPPETGTVSHDVDQWRYWDTRVTSFMVTFDRDGKCVDAGR